MTVRPSDLVEYALAFAAGAIVPAAGPLWLIAGVAVALGVREGRRRQQGRSPRRVASWLPAVAGMGAMMIGGQWLWSLRHGPAPDGGATALAAGAVVATAAVVAALTLGVAVLMARRGGS